MPIQEIKKDFPIFVERGRSGAPFVYLDSGAMAQMPGKVIDAFVQHEKTMHANVHRGIYALSEEATELYEAARKSVQQFINARSDREIIFVRNTTEAINLVAQSLGKSILRPGDHILVSRAEHHSNFLPWLALSEEREIIVDIIDPDENGLITLDIIKKGLSAQTRLAAISHISHVLGSMNPIAEIGEFLRTHNCLFLVDAAQSIAHVPVDVQKIPCDFLAFSGHKMGAPAGIGILYGRQELLEAMPPFLRGGGMIQSLRENRAEWRDGPAKFEAGTPNVSGAIGLAAAINYIQGIGFLEIKRVDEELNKQTFGMLDALKGVRIFGPREARVRGGVVSFAVKDVPAHDLATILDREGICIRAGHHCAIPLHQWLGIPATARASFWVYNTKEDIERLGKGIERAIQLVARDSKEKRNPDFLWDSSNI